MADYLEETQTVCRRAGAGVFWLPRVSRMPEITITYRRFGSLEDYRLFSLVWNESFTNARRSPAEWWARDQRLNTDPSAQRWVAEVDGVILGVAGYENRDEEGYQPHHYLGYVTVHPVLRRLGVGGALYERLQADLAERETESVWLPTRADYAEGLRFLEKRGFQELYRTSFMRLYIDKVNTQMLADYARSLAAEGYEFKNFHELADDPRRDEKFYRLYCAVKPSIPSPIQRQLPDFADFSERIQSYPKYFDGCFIAVRQGEYIGYGLLEERASEERELYTDALGVFPEHRRRGVAFGIILRGVRYAEAIGSKFISEDNYIGNSNVRPLLEKVGFIAEPDWLLYEKRPGFHE